MSGGERATPEVSLFFSVLTCRTSNHPRGRLKPSNFKLPQRSSYPRGQTTRHMAAHLPKERVEASYNSRSNIIDYELTNYEMADAQAAFDRASEMLAKMQLALDAVNSKYTMEIDVVVR